MARLLLLQAVIIYIWLMFPAQAKADEKRKKEASLLEYLKESNKKTTKEIIWKRSQMSK